MWKYIAGSCLLHVHTFIFYSHAFNTHILHVKETKPVVIRVIWRLHSNCVIHFITCDRQQAKYALVSSTRILGISPLNTSFSINLLCIFRQRLITILSSDSSEIIPTRCNNCVYSSQWLYSTCFGWQFHPSSGVQCFIWPLR